MLRVYLIKLKLKFVHIARRFKSPMKVLELENFYSNCFVGEKPSSDYFQNRKNPNFFFNPTKHIEYTKHLKNEYPTAVKNTILRAEKALSHTFDLLGSGETYLGKNIDWRGDFKSGKQWSKNHFTTIKIVNPNDSSDIKVPWELSRLQHFTDLGKAFWITEDESYLREFVNTIEHWEQENQVGYGPNWTCPMDVSIRAINIIWGLYFFSAKNLFSANFIQNTIRLIYYHALYIEQNLEIIEDGTNTNHLLTNYLGLFYIGLLFPEFDRSQKWRQIACNGLEKEIGLEINNDGADYECSTSYHRLVLEIFLSAYILGEKNNFKFSENYKNKLQKMLQFSESITAQSGNAPIIGDNDDGFIVKLSGDNPSSHTHLIELGNELFNTTLPNYVKKSEEILFYFGITKVKRQETKKVKSKLFKDSGYATIRTEKLHLLYTATKITPKALGGHKHNDNLAFTLEHNKTQYFIDPGTYCYTSDFNKRNENRSVAFHNTVAINKAEQNNILPSRLFFMKDDSKPEIDLWAKTDNNIIVSGFHRGFDSLIHRRTIQVNLISSQIEITDEVTGDSDLEHYFETRFITPIEDVNMQKNNVIHINEDTDNQLTMVFDDDSKNRIEIIESEYYPRFGVQKPAKIIVRKQKTKLPLINKTIITLKENEIRKNITHNRIGSIIINDDLANVNKN